MDVSGRALDDGANALDVRVPAALRDVVRMADPVARDRRFSAEVTTLSHASLLSKKRRY
jgi:hypothetical protein